MNILLINPPAFNELKGNNPEIIDSERGYNPPLGLLMIAGCLLENDKYRVKIIDSQVEELSYKKLEKKIREEDFDVAGITAMTFTMIDVMETVNLVKEINPGCKVVIGGSHAGVYPSETISIDGIDIVVTGEGEIVFGEILENLKNLHKVKGILFKDENGNIHNTGAPALLSEEQLNKLPFPARHMTPYKKYSSLLAKRTPITTLFTSRGCPYKCTFCNRPLLGKNFRALSPERVVAEIEDCLKLGIHEFLVYDDTFTVRKKRVKDICNLIIEKKLDIGFDIRTRVDIIDEELLILLKKAGCRGIHYGIEGGTDKILKVLNKEIDLDKAVEIIRLTKKHKIQTLAYFMIGSPTETISDIYETFRFTKKINPDFIHLTILTPFPSTEIYLNGLRDGIIKNDYWKEFAQNIKKGFKPPYWDIEISKKELESLIVKGYKSFYTRPSYILKSIFKIRSCGELYRKLKAGIKVFLMKGG